MLTINSIVYGLQYLFLVSSLLSYFYKIFSNMLPILIFHNSGTQPWGSPEQGGCHWATVQPKDVWAECSEDHERWIIFVAFAMYLIELSRYFTGGNLNGVYFERCLKWFLVQYFWWDDALFSPTIPSNLHWLNLVNKMPCVLTGFQESFSSVIKLIIEPASLLELWC